MVEPVLPSEKLWCAHCNRLVLLDDVHVVDDQQHCPYCDGAIGPDATAPDVREGGADDAKEGPPKAPWHFKLLLVGTVLYLIYRLIWFIFWLSHHA